MCMAFDEFQLGKDGLKSVEVSLWGLRASRHKVSM